MYEEGNLPGAIRSSSGMANVVGGWEAMFASVSQSVHW